jgi:tetratricopeptide (TPR) repeat protein
MLDVGMAKAYRNEIAGRLDTSARQAYYETVLRTACKQTPAMEIGAFPETYMLTAPANASVADHRHRAIIWLELMRQMIADGLSTFLIEHQFSAHEVSFRGSGEGSLLTMYLNYKAWMLEAIGKWEDAIGVFDEAITMSGGLPTSQGRTFAQNKALLLADMLRWEEAADGLAEIAGHAENAGDLWAATRAYVEAAKVLEELWRLPQALALVSKAIILGERCGAPQLREAHALRLKITAILGRRADAEIMDRSLEALTQPVGMTASLREVELAQAAVCAQCGSPQRRLCRKRHQAAPVQD